MNKRIFKVIFLIFSVWLLVKTSQSTYEIWKKRDIVAESKSELSQVEAENSRLKRELENVQSDEYVEKQARNILGLVKPGEIIVLLTTPVPTQKVDSYPKNTNIDSNLPNWKKWWKLFN
jgi:cell division protein FtsB